jgi:hypothetical protein
MEHSGGVAEAKIVLRRAGPILGVGVEEEELFKGVTAGETAVMSLENNLSISDPAPLMAAIDG